MTGTLNKVVIFIAGAAVGSVVTWKFVKTKYEQIAQEEIDSVKEIFTQRYASDEELDEEVDGQLEISSSSETVDIRELAGEIQKRKYTSYSAPDKEVETLFDDDGYVSPYVIAPEDFDELEEYETRSLTHYADGVLADDRGNIIEDVEGAVGKDYASHFGEYEDDSVFIRNDNLKIDYEILAHPGNYSDVVNQTPHSGEDE